MKAGVPRRPREVQDLGIYRHWSIAALFEAGWAPAAVFVFHLLLARVLRLYLAHPTVDIAMHFLGGLAIAFFFWRTSVHASKAGVIGGINRTGIGVVVFGLTCAAAVFWEFAEYLSDRYFGTNTQLGLSDTLGDMLCGIVGGSVFVAAMGLLAGGAPRSPGTAQPGREAGFDARENRRSQRN
jgi:hypothetical protein